MRSCLHHGIGVRRSESSELSAGRIYAYLVASDLRSSPSGWLSRAPTVALLRDRKVASGVLCVVVRLLQPAASLPRPQTPLSRTSVITFGLICTR